MGDHERHYSPAGGNTVRVRMKSTKNPGVTEIRRGYACGSALNALAVQRRANEMESLVQLQVVVQGNAGLVGLVALDTQGRVWYGDLSGAPAPARYSIKWTKIEERIEGAATRKA